MFTHNEQQQQQQQQQSPRTDSTQIQQINTITHHYSSLYKPTAIKPQSIFKPHTVDIYATPSRKINPDRSHISSTSATINHHSITDISKIQPNFASYETQFDSKSQQRKTSYDTDQPNFHPQMSQMDQQNVGLPRPNSDFSIAQQSMSESANMAGSLSRLNLYSVQNLVLSARDSVC